MAGVIGAVVLAAGASTRLGRPKQLLPHRGATLLDHVVTCAIDGGCAPTIVVLGAGAQRIRDGFDAGRAHVVVNREWREGMSSSVRAGVEALLRGWPEARAVMLLTCDQFEVTPDVVRGLIERFAAAKQPIAACEYAGTIGVPAIFDRSLFDALLGLRGGGGAKPLILERGDRVARLAWPAGSRDVDDEADEARREG